MSFRKFESGNDKRKRKRRVDALIESQRGSIDNFFKSSTAASMNPDEMAIVALDEPTNENEEENVDIGVDDNNVTRRTPFMHRVHKNNLLVLMSNRFTLWIFMIQEIRINLIIKHETY